MDLKDKIWQALEDVIDPEVGVNIVDLGLVYELDVNDKGDVKVTMTLTVPQCPLRDEIVADVKEKAKGVDGVGQVDVHLVFEPAWTPAMMNDRAIEEFRRRQMV